MAPGEVKTPSESPATDKEIGAAGANPAKSARQLRKEEKAKLSAEKLAAQNEEANPGERLIQVLGRKLVVTLSVGSVLLAVALCLLLGFFPSLQAAEASRFFLLLLISFLFGVFAFTLYPSNYKLDLDKGYKIPLVLAGPAALWIGLFILFLNLFPKLKHSGIGIPPGP